MAINDFNTIPIEGFEFGRKILQGQSFFEGCEGLNFIIVDYYNKIIQAVPGANKYRFPGGPFLAFAITNHNINLSLYLQAFSCHGHSRANGQAVPELAENLEPSADAKTWVVKLRTGIEFHSGKTFDADDAIASLEHHRGEDSTSDAKSVANSLGNIRKDGQNTLIFELESGNADFPYLLSDYHLLMGSADSSGKVDWASGDGTGAFVVKNFEPGVRSHMVRNSNYWKPGCANFDEIKITAINDAAARMNAMVTGQMDAIVRCDLKTAPMLEKKAGISVIQVSGTKHFTYPMDVRQAPFNDNNVRMALKHGINREVFVNTVLRGYGSVGNDHPISSNQNYHAGDLPQRQYDVDKAKWYLKQAGLTSLDVEIAAADAAFNGAVDATLLYSEAA